MSVTLRDAQHLCWKNFRKINDHLYPERGRSWTPSVAVADLMEETGEVAKATKELESHEKLATKETLAVRLSDLLYTIFILAEHYGIELEESFLQTVNDKVISSIR